MSERCSLEPTAEGANLVVRWEQATTELANARRRVNGAECEAANARNALGKWLLPKDAKPGETYMVAYGARWVAVTAPLEPGRDARVEWREMGGRRG